MDRIVRQISLDFQRQTNTRVTFATQNDFNSRVFLVTLYDDGVEFPLPKNVLPVMNVLRPDGEGGAYFCEVQDDGKVRYVAGAWELAVPGEALFSLSVYDGEEKKLTSGSFTVEIAALPYTGDEISDDSDAVSTFEEMMDSLANIKIAENGRSNSEIIRNENEKLRNKNEQARIKNEQSRSEIAQKAIDGLDGVVEIQNRFIDRDIPVSTTLSMLDIYPVGSIYLSVSSVDPSTLFGGTWEQLKDRFLLGAGNNYPAGSVNGTANVKIETRHLPPHSHTYNIVGRGAGTSSGPDVSVVGAPLSNAACYYAIETVETGFGDPLYNMPPYITVYMWKRIG